MSNRLRSSQSGFSLPVFEIKGREDTESDKREIESDSRREREKGGGGGRLGACLDDHGSTVYIQCSRGLTSGVLFSPLRSVVEYDAMFHTI